MLALVPVTVYVTLAVPDGVKVVELPDDGDTEPLLTNQVKVTPPCAAADNVFVAFTQISPEGFCVTEGVLGDALTVNVPVLFALQPLPVVPVTVYVTVPVPEGVNVVERPDAGDTLPLLTCQVKVTPVCAVVESVFV